MLRHVWRTARSGCCPVRVIRKDIGFRCGPLGGIHTGLVTSRGSWVLFLTCDMPFVPGEWLLSLIRRAEYLGGGVWMTATAVAGRIGFPMVVSVGAASRIAELRAAGRYSISGTAAALNAELWVAPEESAAEFLNVNTPAELIEAEARWAERSDAFQERLRSE